MNQSHVVLQAAQRWSQEGQPYALVTVLRALPPASAKPGDKALVTSAGIVEGWIGGGCAQPAVIKTVRRALVDGRSRIIRISPSDDGSERELGDILEFGMSCHSGGTLELFVDPVLPNPMLTILGDTPLSRALSVLAPRVGLPAMVVAHGAEASSFPDAQRVFSDDQALPREIMEAAQSGYVVVATQGRRDLQGLRAALALQARATFFVASARKAEVLKRSLVEAGENEAAVRAIIAPAGQPIGAQTPQEIALSVLAAVVAERRRGFEPAQADAALTQRPAEQPVTAAAVVKRSCCGG